MIRMKRHTIIVTGTSSGLGFATATQLLDNEFSVLGIDIQTAEIEHQNYTHVEMNLASVDIEELQQKIAEDHWFGFIHCAGISRGGRLDTLSVEDWNLSLDVNVTSAMKICQLADSHMMDGGRILLVGSPVGIAGANKPSYAASKAPFMA